MRVKICGITNIADAQLCSDYLADAIGFIFYPRSKRYISPEKAGEITAAVNPIVKKIGVFVNQEREDILETVKLAGLDAVQLHGDESPGFAASLGVNVIKAFRVKENINPEEINRYKNCGILLDSWSETEYGGTGKGFDLSLIPHEIRGKIILAGGISNINIVDIYKNINPAAIDVSSSLEISPGKKDHNKLKKFLKTAAELKRGIF